MVKRMMSLPYSAELIRQHDPNRFLISLLMPAKHRVALWALFAFNYEIAKTREVVSEQTIGLIRLQWWRDAIAEIYEGRQPRKHEIVSALAEMIRVYNLDRELFDNLIYAREFDLEGVAPANLEGLLNYCHFTSTPLHQLVMSVLGHEVKAATVKNIATTNTLVTLIRSVPYLFNQGRVMLPQEVLSAHQLGASKILDTDCRESLPLVIKDCLQHITWEGNPRSKYLKSIQKLSQMYHAQIVRCDYDVFHPKMLTPPACMALRLWINSVF